MKHKHATKAGAALVAATLAGAAVSVATAAAKTPKVSVRVEGLSRTLVPAKLIQTRSGSVKRQGHEVVGTTALGALNTVTHGRWTGTWDAEFSEWELIGILGEQHPFTSKYFWAVYLDNTLASTGAGEAQLKSGDKVVFAALPDSDYDEELLGVAAPGSIASGSRFRVRVVYYNAAGRAHALAGATVSLDGHSVTSGSGGIAHLRAGGSGTETLRVSDHGYVRTETSVRVRG